MVYDSWPDVDLAVLKVRDFDFKALNWISGTLREFEAVRTLGFAFGLDVEEKSLTSRAFAGSVVSSRPLTPLPGRPWGYELTFAAPRGLSGAALMLAHRR